MGSLRARRGARVFLRAPETFPLLGFLLLILLGSVLLVLPLSHHRGAVSYLDALFTSTSAVCVTGLTTVNTATGFTVTGQVVILVLIQLGGLGVMAYAALAMTVARRRVSLRTRAALADSLFYGEPGREFVRRLREVFVAALGLETAGAVALFVFLLAKVGASRAAWMALFHSVSAFCNAGFSILPDNLVSLRSNHPFMAVVTVLIVCGGLGLVVLRELGERLVQVVRPGRLPGKRRLSLHTRIVLITSLALIVGGGGLMLLLGMTPTGQSWGERAAAAFFQSVSARTCGFNTIDIGALPLASLLVLVMLMFIGGSPGSCAGGVKTTSLAVILARLRSHFRGQEHTTLMGWRLGSNVVRNAGLLFSLALLWNLIGLLFLAYFESGKPDVGLSDLLFEQISAFGTVGLSTGITAGLSGASKLWLIATMYVGRLGPLTLVSLAVPPRPAYVLYPEGKVMVG